jgi:WD40 repeat protein
LPEGAVSRLGTIRWRYPDPVELVQFSRDGKQLLSCCGDGVIHVSDAVTGKLLRRFGHRDGALETASADGATVVQGTPDGRIHAWDVSTGKETGTFDPGFRDELRGMKFVKGDQLVAWGAERSIKIWDIETGKLLRVLTDDVNALPGLEDQDTLLQFAASPDGSTCACTMRRIRRDGPWTACLYVWALKDGKSRGAVEVPWRGGMSLEYSSPVFSPDGKYLLWFLAGHALQVFRADDLKQVRCLGDAAWDDEVWGTFSPDGNKLAIPTRAQTIRLLDFRTGQHLGEIGEPLPEEQRGWRGQRRQRSLSGSKGTPTCHSCKLAWSPSSTRIAQGCGPGLMRIWDTATGKGNDSGVAPVGAILGLLPAPDAKSVVTLGRDHTVRTWDVASATEQHKVSLPANAAGGELIDARRVLLRSREGALTVWDSAEEEELFRLRHKEPPGKEPAPYSTRDDVSNDGRWLFTGDRRSFHGWDPLRPPAVYNLATGVEREGAALKWTNGQDRDSLVSLAQSGSGARVAGTVAVFLPIFTGMGPEYQFQIRCKRSEEDRTPLWTVRTRREKEVFWAVSFTPDDRSLLTYNRDRKTEWVSLLEALTGKERCRFRAPVPGPDWSVVNPRRMYAFSRHGDLLAVSRIDCKTTVFDLRLGREIATLTGDQGDVSSLAFGPGSDMLFTGGQDGTVLIWDLREHLRKARQAVQLSAEDVERLWAELADRNTARAYRAVAALVTAPAQAADLFREKLKPVARPPAAVLDKLIADLDHDEHAVREKASAELLRLGPQVIGPLTRIIERTASLEQRKRAASLLAELKQRELAPGPEELREVRAVEVLEAIRTPPAQVILESLAKGSPGVRITDEAAAALERLLGRQR